MPPTDRVSPQVCWTVSYTLSVSLRHASHALFVFGAHADAACYALGKTYATYLSTILASTLLNYTLTSLLQQRHDVALVATASFSVVWSYFALRYTWKDAASPEGGGVYQELETATPIAAGGSFRGRYSRDEEEDESAALSAGDGGSSIGDDDDDEEEEGGARLGRGYAPASYAPLGSPPPRGVQSPQSPCLPTMAAPDSPGCSASSPGSGSAASPLRVEPLERAGSRGSWLAGIFGTSWS